MKRTYWFFVIIGVIIFLIFLVRKEYKKFRYYTSTEVVTEMDYWWLHIDRFYKNHNKIPTVDDFFNYGKNDSFVIENFPNMIPDGLDKNDFVITTDSILYFSVWLFSEGGNRDTLFYSKMNFLDFLLKKSALVTNAPLSDLSNSFPPLIHRQ
jgi:bacteriorhodopsin